MNTRSKKHSNRKTVNYSFGIKRSKLLCGIKLADGTWLLVKKNQPSGITLMFPKKKFNKIFQTQMQDRKREYLAIAFSRIELKAISKGLDLLRKKPVNEDE